MIEWDDHELIAEFARSGSGEAFSVLVARNVNLVYSAALRFTRNPNHAEEISQAVFIILARKAAGLGRGVVLSGWLYQTARLTAANFMKGEIRRQHREQEAYMQSTLNESGAPEWDHVAPLLEEAMGTLGATDRNAVVLRFFENKSGAEVAALLNLTEATAHKRVARAVEKLRKFFARRGVVLTAAAIAGTVAANSTQAAPAALAQSISAAALAKGAGAGGSTFILAKGVLKIMAWTKVKTAVAVAATAVFVGGTATFTVIALTNHPSQRPKGVLAPGPMDNLTTKDVVTRSADAYAALNSYSDEGISSSTIGKTKVAPQKFSIKLARPNLYRVEWTQNNGFSVNSGIVWNAGDGDFTDLSGKPQRQVSWQKPGQPQRLTSRDMALGGATGVSGGAAAHIPGTFFKMNWGNQLDGWVQSAKRKPDEMIDGVPCYVLATDNRVLCIGRQDFLIRQIENVTSAKALQTLLNEQMKKYPGLAAGLKSAPAGDVVAIETHRNIVVDAQLAPSDFAR